MITTSMSNMMGGVEVCWTEYQQSMGAQNKTAFWRFKPAGQTYPDPSDYDFGGALSCRLGGGTDCPDFPINIVDLLSFLILVYVAGKFGEVVNQIASEISNSYANIDTGGRKGIMDLNNTEKHDLNPNTAGATKPPPMTGKR
jgi:hypothetical protein